MVEKNFPRLKEDASLQTERPMECLTQQMKKREREKEKVVTK